MTLHASVNGRYQASADYRSDLPTEYLEGYPVVLHDDAGTPFAGWLRLRQHDGTLRARFDTVNVVPNYLSTGYYPTIDPTLTTTFAPTPAPNTTTTATQPAAAGVIVRLHHQRDTSALARAHDLHLVRHVGNERTVLLRDTSEPERDPNELARALALDARVEFAEPNTNYGALAHYPPASLLSSEHHLFHTGAPATWALAGAPVTVAVIDSGFVLDLLDFAGATILEGADFCPTFGAFGCEGFDRDPSALDLSNNHGTMVLATILAQRNERATTGVAPAVRALPIKVGPDVTFPSLGLAEVVDALLWAAGETLPGVPVNPNPADVVNLSLGTTSDSILLREAIERLDELGIVVVAAAGNEGATSLQYPAAYPSVISVAAGQSAAPTDRADWSNHGDGLDLLAPGENVLTGCLGSLNGTAPEQICGATGTSFAAPIVTGAAALVLAQDPHRTPEHVRELLRASAYRDPNASAFETGAGLLRIDGALGLPAPTGPHDRTLTLELGTAQHSVALTTDLLTGIGNEVDASALLGSGTVTLQFVHDQHAFRADFALRLALVRQPPDRP